MILLVKIGLSCRVYNTKNPLIISYLIDYQWVSMFAPELGLEPRTL